MRVEDVFKGVGIAVCDQFRRTSISTLVLFKPIHWTTFHLVAVDMNKAIRTPLSGGALGLIKDPTWPCEAVAFGSNSQ